MKISVRTIGLILSICVTALILLISIFGSNRILELSANFDSPLIAIVRVICLLIIVFFVILWVKRK